MAVVGGAVEADAARDGAERVDHVHGLAVPVVQLLGAALRPRRRPVAVVRREDVEADQREDGERRGDYGEVQAEGAAEQGAREGVQDLVWLWLLLLVQQGHRLGRHDVPR